MRNFTTFYVQTTDKVYRLRPFNACFVDEGRHGGRGSVVMWLIAEVGMSVGVSGCQPIETGSREFASDNLKKFAIGLVISSVMN